MFTNSTRVRAYSIRCVLVTVASAGTLLGVWACNNAGTVPTPNNNTLINDAIGFQGSITGKLADTQSTRQSVDGSAAQTLPTDFDPATTVVRFKDLNGADLEDINGIPIGGVPVDANGQFSADGLPVGTDFTICGDFGNDGICDVESSVNIPAEQGSTRGRLDGVEADPLTTLVLGKLRKLMADLEIKVEDLPFSPAALAARVVDSYVNLFEDAGVDQTITLDSLKDLSRDEIAALFDEIMPAIAATGIKVAQGNLEVVKATDAEEVALAVAKIFLQAGFPIADLPGGPDLSSLGDLENVTITTPEALFSDKGPIDEFEGPVDDFGDGPLSEIPPELLAGFSQGEIDAILSGDIPTDLLDSLPEGTLDDILLGVAQVDDPNGPVLIGERVYISTITEPDRNFGGNGDGNGDAGGAPTLPLLTDQVLFSMAKLQLEGRTISFNDLYELLTSVDKGLGVRLVYQLFDPNFFGPPRTVFETADGSGKAINLERIFSRLFDAGIQDVDAESFDSSETNIRSIMKDILKDTVAPTFGRLFGSIARDRIPGIEELANDIREARVHLPFNRSGPSTFFVVADGDPFRGDGGGKAVTVDADITVDGKINSVTFNEAGTGKYYLVFTEGTDERGIVELIVRETGRFVHGNRGPARFSIFDDTLVGTASGTSFSSIASASGTFYPGTNISIIRTGFVFDGDSESEFGLNEQLFVLASGVNEDSEPVRVDYDPTTGIATFNPGGRSLLAFTEDSEDTGVFRLFNEDTGRFAGEEDPVDFFMAPPEQPEGFDDLFNEPGFEDPDFMGDPNDPALDGTDPSLDGSNDPTLDGTMDTTLNGSTDSGSVDTTTTDPSSGVAPAQFDSATDSTTDSATDTTPTTSPDPGPDMGFVEPTFILISADQVVGLEIAREDFSFVFGIEVPNAQHNADFDPFFDDVNGNGILDPGEPTAPFRPTLFNPDDWRSTDLRLYYRRADNDASVTFEEISFDATTPTTIDGVALIARNYIARVNAFRFGRPNSAVNMLTAFAPTNLFDGAHGLTRDTRIDIFMAIALINLTMDQIFNTEADIDIDGRGPLPKTRTLIDANLFVTPINDPFQLLARGFERRAEARR